MSQKSLAELRTWLAEQELDAFLVSDAMNRSYLSGWYNEDTESAGWLLVGPEQQYILTNHLYAEEAEKEAAGWTVVLPEARQYAAAVVTHAQKHGWKKIGFESHALSFAVYEQLRSLGESVYTLHPYESSSIEASRVVKQPHELDLLRKAFEITDAAFAHICEWIQPGMTEKQVLWEIYTKIVELGGDSAGLWGIVASGPNGSMPHAQPSERQIQRGEFITIDMGARYKGYHADMTRTFSLGEPTDPQMREVWEAVHFAMKECEAGLRAGVNGVAADALARNALEMKNLAQYYVHSTGHGVGLQIHEAPSLSQRAPQDVELPAGSVVTIEPGVYIPGKGGVRLEDSALITENGIEILTKSPCVMVLPK
ncbi:Xaa-Pro aminopeptidase [Thermosporothrix hazakensis]|uniref:Xaa-Pro aminopeptidase n=2 Tax=Thermosporothrix TaxID=768650 RepID=A0A326UPQ9_THEHA|nr:Xaa-Pro peptidase family protein [Thermosporothrix hazakensis]PZW36169.1 Xaa-Pro aminopeptidase [Thermosporothrix hazakensis]BBH88634.1 Xaa-Pro dipeptidase [Thermosporothrix sp. COM3]GCE46819.1 Xaa-Pro dipeptidase [Thermosporothrix hazakensis]